MARLLFQFASLFFQRISHYIRVKNSIRLWGVFENDFEFESHPVEKKNRKNLGMESFGPKNADNSK